MPEVGFLNLFVVALVAFLVPLGLGLAPGLRIPSPVVLILAGIVLGPGVLGWVQADLPVQVLAVIGLAFLLFLAGLEIDLSMLHGRPLMLALTGFGITLALGLLAGALLGAAGWVRSPVLIAITLSATSLGLVVPVLKDAAQLESAVGRNIVVAASVADFGAVLLLSLFFSASGSGSGTGGRLVLLAAFVLLVGLLALAVRQAGRSMRLSQVLVRLQDTTAEIRVRGCVALLLALVALA